MIKQQYFNRCTTKTAKQLLNGGGPATLSGSTLKIGAANGGTETNTDITYMSNPSSSPPFTMPTNLNTINGNTTTKLVNNNVIVMASNPRCKFSLKIFIKIFILFLKWI